MASAESIDVAAERCDRYIHATVTALLETMPADPAHSMALLFAVMNQLITATAVANVILGGNSGSDAVAEMLSLFPQAVEHRTRRLLHQCEQRERKRA